MINIDLEALNALERRIHATLTEHSKQTDNLRIKEASELCGCSVSKISKFVKKLGFNNFKQYLDFLYDRETPETALSTELHRLRQFIDGFDSAKVDELAKIIGSHSKLVLLGYGPSHLCAQYFEYKFKTCTNRLAIAVPDALSAKSMSDENTLLLIFTVTGSFTSFEEVYKDTKQKGGDVVIIVEEYNPEVIAQCDKTFFLTQAAQSNTLRPFEKTRSMLFIFMEEVIKKLMER
ncbi:MurR/RpiR family transcriptional regulator [Polycladidibacter stylochi]|uniref:MurR/RpiR family transcriptional regulator n=1 Tax=Polycladidibacter stylochi TaxID=1807766 RepID=UPI000837A24F|nr:SIS domain-containing protein [Pseudovibrio stylochi]